MKPNPEINRTPTPADAPLGRRPTPAAQIERAKRGILAQFHDTFAGREKLLRLAVTEAEALAWATDYPQLVFPTLALEKAQTAAAWQERQEALRKNGSVHSFAA
jgi:hypothetical protein